MSKAARRQLLLERFVPYRLSVLSNQVSSAIAESYRDKFALSITEWRIMAVLGEYPGISGEEVSQKTKLEKSMLSRAIQKLLKRHLIEREVDDEDRRRQVLNLSVLGEDIYKQIVPLSLDFETELLQCFSTTERRMFEELVDRLLAHSRQLEENSD